MGRLTFDLLPAAGEASATTAAAIPAARMRHLMDFPPPGWPTLWFTSRRGPASIALMEREDGQ